MKREQFTSLLSGALAMHEPSLNEMLATFDANSLPEFRVRTKASEEQAGYWDEEFPTVNDLIVGQGVAVVPIHGMMIKRNRWWIVGSDYWSEMILEITNRSDIEAIVLDIDSGGGQVAGTERLGDAIWKARQAGKMTIGVVNEFCASAALWAASQCERVVIPATGSIGSLGVYTLHYDDSKFLAENGVDKSVIYRGKYKGIDERSLDADAKADLQRFIDGKYSLFVDAVARGRGLSSEEVTQRWGESQLFTGSEAVSNGLADEIGTLQDVLESLRAGRGGRVSIEVPPAEGDPETDPEGDQNAMVKINATGQILDTTGKAVGNVSELQIDAAGLTKYFAAQSGELIESAVKTAKEAAIETQKAALAEADKARVAQLDALVAAVGPVKGIAAFKAGQTIEAAKAALADDLALQVKEKDEEIAKLKAGNATGGKAPEFIASDSAGKGPAATVATGERTDFAADWDANKGNCQDEFRNEKEYAAYRRHKG